MARRTIGGLCLVLVGLVPGVAMAQTEQVYYYHTDAVGSVRMITDANGQEVVRYDYWPFGQQSGTAAPDPRMFAGKEHDGESAFEYFDVRYYGSPTGRFTSPDPLGGHLTNPQTLNRYAYAGNNPLRFADPNGLDFYLQCERESDTCHEGRVGAYVKPKVFDPTIITSASLRVPTSGNSATVGAQGVMITSAEGAHQGIFINGTPAADIEGSGLFGGFSFHIDHSDQATGVLASGTATFAGTRDELIERLSSSAWSFGGWRRFGIENTLSWIGRHPTGHNDATNLRFSNGWFPK